MKNLYLLTVLLMFIGMIPLIQSEITPNFPGNQPLVIDGNDQPSTVDKLMIDSFEIESNTIVILLNEDAPPSVSNFEITTNSQILGGERDIILTVLNGKAGRVITAGVNANQFQLATPSDISGVCDIQYDGIDGSPDLSFPGLGNFDLTLNNSLGFRIRATTDISTGVIITVYSGNGVSSSFRISIIGNEVPTDYLIPYNTFSVLVDFADIVAIVLSVEANENVDLYITEFAIYGDSIPPSGVAFADRILPCDTHYYRIGTLSDLRPGDYVKISFNQSSDFDSLGVFYVSSSNYTNLADELTSNVNIVDTLGELPGPTNYLYKCDVAQCTIEITSCQLEETTYYLAIAGNDAGLMFYSVDISLRRTPVYQIFPQTPQTLFFDQRPDTEDHTLFYSYYLIDIPESLYSEGTYLIVNITNVQSIADLEMRLNYGGLPESSFNTGVIGSTDFSSYGEQVDDCTFQFCVDTSRASNEPFFDHPVATQPRIPCVCTTSNELGGPNTCNITVDPCHFRYGTWYISILLPPNTDNRVDASNYTIIPYIIQPAVHSLFRNESIKGSVYPERSTHYKLTVPASDVTVRNSSLIVQISNIRNGFVNLWVHQEMGGNNNLAGPEGCVPSNATCRSRDSCTIVIEKCYFVPGTWYMSVSIDFNATSNEFAIFEPDRLPITFTINATWVNEPTPTPIYSGVPVIGSIGESLYDFYVLNVPKTIDTWLFVELYSRCEDTDIILSVLHGSLPGGECYDMPDFYCITGFDGAISRKSCTFMIQTCELEAGPLFFSVYGYHTNLEVYGNTTFYQIPSQYTLYVDFDTALPLRNGVSYQDSVVEFQYQHYYIRADRVYQGSYLTAEVTNIQHGTPQSLAVFVNYNYLAGNCPCYDHLYNCTGEIVEDEASFENFTCCTIVVPPSDFRGGVWYISVLGMNQDLEHYSTPIGYTLTVTVHYPPEFFPLFLGQEASATVPKFNASLEYTHFKLAAVPIPLHDLVITVVYNQNCFFLGKHDNFNDSLSLFVKANLPANDRAYDYSCQASVSSESYCTIVVPHCEWISNDYFLSVQGINSAEFDARFTIRAKLEEIRDFQLTSGVTVYNRVSTGTYKHFFIDTNGIHNDHLEINLYTNQDQDFVSVYLNFDNRAGTFPCYSNIDSCEEQRVCFWQINAVDIKEGRYYLSVFGERQWYDTPVEFTLTAEFKQFALQLKSSQPFTNHIIVEQKHYYRYSVNELDFGDHLSILVDNVDYGAVTVYVNYNYAAGTCVGYLYKETCFASSLNTDWCQIRIPSCELKKGDYFITVVGESSFSECENPLQKIGYSIEVLQITPSLVYPEVNVGRDMNTAQHFQFITDANYVHYQFRYTKNDYLNGYHIMVEIFNVLEGSLFAYYNKGSSSDSDIDCQLAQICNNGLSSNDYCIWQIPFSLSKPTYVDNGDDNINLVNFQYITIESLSGRSMASYSILIWKQPAITVLANPTFTLDNTNSSFFFPANTELNITHFDYIQPNGGVQFIKLLDVPSYSEGDMLEVFFYRVINNPGESTSFNVYIFPEMPAGAHECCVDDPSIIGSCLGAPSLRTVDTTTQVPDGSELISHLCDLPDGVGFSEDDPFFGYRCTVRVWPCTFSRYCEEATTWWMSIVPTEPTPIEETGPLDGLSYSVQWRTRNIRVNDQLLDSISLNDYINTYEFSDAIPLYSSNTESEGWMSFYIDVVPTDHSRISIQTDFLNGTGEVYIRPDDFASPPFDLCSSYYCATNSDANCRDFGRFISDECHSAKHSRYYITVRSLSGADTITLVSFRIIKIDQPAIVQIPAHLTSTNSFNVTSGLLASENYDTYVMPIDDSDIADHQTLLIDVTRPLDDEGTLILYVRYGSQAGDFGGGSNTLNAQGCYTWLYSCELLNATSRCTLQIPHSDLIQGYWYISLYNPDFNYNGISDNLPEYSMVVFLQSTPTELQLGAPLIGDTSNEFPGTYINYRLTVTANDIGLYGPKENTGIIYNGDYHTSYLRFIIDDFEGNITMYINYDDLAGEPTQLFNPFGYYQQSLDFIRSIDCSSDSLCYIDILPCDRENQKSFKLKSGIYYISLLSDTVTSFNISAHVLTEDYVIMNEELVEKSNHHLWMHTVDSTDLLNEGDGYYYRYTFNTVDEIRAYDYIIINFTMPEEFISENVTLDLKVWRDDCSGFTCSLPEDGESWCVIDAVSLAPCNLKGGRYYFEVFNPNSVPFSIFVYQNETITQPLIDQQIITEVIHPYEYQEYFFEAFNVVEGATLTVQVCAECGEVEAWIRPRHPAGPNCGIDHCTVSSGDERSCCTMFLDTCQYSQQGYYIAVRGVSTDFPNEVNPTLYLPAKYQIQANQTNIHIDNIAFECPIKKSPFDTSFPSQYAIDLESANIGTLLRFTLVLPVDVRLLQNEMEEFATLSISFNRTVGYTLCENSPFSCSIGFEQDTLRCEVIIPAEFVSPGRYYIWADAPEGSIITVQRWDPYIPIIQPNLLYTATLNGPIGSINNQLRRSNLNGPIVESREELFMPATQYYRFDLDFDGNYGLYNETFFLRVLIKNIQHGTLSATLNSGFFPLSEVSSNKPTPIFLDNSSCTDGYDCAIDLALCDLFPSEDEFQRSLANTFWITVKGIQQVAELHPIQYSLIVQTNWIFTYYPIDHTVCNSVEVNEYNFHRIRPHANEVPQHSFLRFHLSRIDANAGDEVAFLLKDNSVPTRGCYDLAVRSGFVFGEGDNEGVGTINVDWLCPYQNLYLSVFGISSENGPIDYLMNVTRVPVKVIELFDDRVYHSDDDDTDACGSVNGEYDFFIFNATASQNAHSAFMRVAVHSEFPFTVYLNKGGFGFEECHIDKASSEGGSVNLYDFCTYSDSSYFITVISNGPYYIYTHVRDDSKALTLGQVYRDTLEQGQYQMYTLEICDHWFAADDRLAIEISDVQNGGVIGWIQLNSNAGPFSTPDESGICNIPNTHANAEYKPGRSGYDFILIDHSILNAGTYHILIQAQSDVNSEYDNPQFVSFRLFPYLDDLEIDPAPISPNSIISNLAVDFFNLDRVSNRNIYPHTLYYQMQPLTEGNFTFAFSQIRLQNVKGGHLNLRVTVGHLATPPFDFISGKSQALLRGINFDHNIHSGRRPYTLQEISDRISQFSPDCDGSSDFCSFMSTDKDPQYKTAKSSAVWIPSCAFDINTTLYISVEASHQFNENTPINFELVAEQIADYTFLPPDTGITNQMTHSNWQYHFYRSIQSTLQSARWRVVVSEGEGVLVTVRNHRCPLQATWTREIWCDANYFGNRFICDIEIPTEAAHPGDNAFFISVYGRNATYTIAYWRGLQNCHVFHQSGYPEGLDFCAGIVDYPTWRWDDYQALDHEANCFFEELYQHFKVQPCWSGVTSNCNATLRQFACYESFKGCDQNGFYSGTCRSACNAVAYQCTNWFQTVDLEHYNCTSPRYISDGTSYCTGGGSYSWFDENTQLFFGNNPADILYDPYLNRDQSSASSLALSSILFVALFAIFFL